MVSKNTKYDQAVTKLFFRTYWLMFCGYSARFNVQNDLKLEHKNDRLNWSRVFGGFNEKILTEPWLSYDEGGNRETYRMNFGHKDHLHILMESELVPETIYEGDKRLWVNAKPDSFGVPLTEKVSVQINGDFYNLNINLTGGSHSFDEILKIKPSPIANDYESFSLYEGDIDEQVSSWAFYCGTFNVGDH